MLRRVAAWCFAASIVVWPVFAGGDTGTFSNSPAATLAVVLAVTPAPVAAPVPAPAPAPVRQPAVSRSGDFATAKTDDKSGNSAQAQIQIDTDAGVPEQTAALDRAQPVIAKPPQPMIAAPPQPEPFDLAATPVPFGDVLTKWQGVETAIHTDNEILARCRDNAGSCPQAAQKFLAIVAQGRAQTGRARIGIINRAVNLAIEPMSDMAQWGVPDRWSDPLETFTTGRGDCEDYAIAKYVALTAAGIPAPDVKLVIVRNTGLDEDHAVVAVRSEGDWIILDNRWLMMVKDVDMARAIPRFVLDDDGVRQFSAPALTVARRAPTPASL
jgi:predicted transglutaminase-like cysteine proteinase